MSDIFQTIGALADAGVQRVVDRLEYRAKHPPFVRMRDAYLERLDLDSAAVVLDLGCGTGVVARAIAARPAFRGRVVGIDTSPALLDAARHFAHGEGVASRLEFRTGDAHALDEQDGAFDAVILHTLLSHVPDPVAVLAEAARVVRPGGTVVIFDGDYASLTYATGDRELDAVMVRAILSTIVANMFVMRELPALLRRLGLAITGFIPGVLAEAVSGAFFASLAESYAPLTVAAHAATSDQVERWLAANREAAAQATFFASCNYHTYLARRSPSAEIPADGSWG